MKNLALQALASRGEALENYDGMCGEVADLVFHLVDDEARACCLYVEGDLPQGWTYHMVAVVDGLVHDAWDEGEPTAPAAYLARMFGKEYVTVALNGEDFYEGRADKFPVDWAPPAATIKP